MINEARTKINDEMEKENNPYVKLIGEYLLEVIKNNETAAEKILDKDKSIMKSFDEMRKVAEKVKVGNMAMISDEEGFSIVLKYFGIEKSEPKVIDDIKAVNIIERKVDKEEASEDMLDISLDAYL
ncbi:Cas9 inhibitor AcrIIA9 family protein [uncultured Clostridium sp.]|uniref:Cas9 inhibitor AcrIIA9 family protein n=1 Tax=uncultured Clostridium sp. TaxID=59620 RepID=UPI0025F0E5C4|nr:Cas9 inhibitor AcrIIA9 family protein [uncultured Clostridium sp.]